MGDNGMSMKLNGEMAEWKKDALKSNFTDLLTKPFGLPN